MVINNYIKLVLILLLTCFSTSCSVVMSASKSGTSIEDLAQSKTRTAVIINDGVEIVHTERDPDDNHIIYEDYLVQKPKGSTWRAVMHGLLDVATLGIWEVVGTPVELSKGDKIYVPIRIFYDENEEITKLEYLS